MKAIVISLADEGAASPTRKTNLKFASQPDPKLHENELLVKVAASPIQPSDLLNTQGNFPHTTFPRVPGRDFAGVVVQPTSSPWHGKSVYGTSGPELGFTCDGAHAEFVVVHEDAVAEVPQGMDLKQASVMGVPWTTAYIALTRAYAKKGETVLVFGAGGAVGGAVAQLAKSSLFRCRVFTAGRGDKYDVDTAKYPDLKVAKDLTFGSGPDVIVDTTGDLGLMEAGLRQLNKGGRLTGELILRRSIETHFVPSSLVLPLISSSLA
jgi:NADPH:quinone reductase